MQRGQWFGASQGLCTAQGCQSQTLAVFGVFEQAPQSAGQMMAILQSQKKRGPVPNGSKFGRIGQDQRAAVLGGFDEKGAERILPQGNIGTGATEEIMPLVGCHGGQIVNLFEVARMHWCFMHSKDLRAETLCCAVEGCEGVAVHMASTGGNHARAWFQS